MSDELLLVGSLIIAGYLLLLLEAFVIPGFGIAGLGALGCLALGVMAAYRSFDMLPATGILVGVVVTTTLLLWWIPRTRMGKDVVHKSSLGSARASDDRRTPGERGVAESDLRPAGIARFGEERDSVVTEGEFIASGESVTVVEVRGSRVVVETAFQSAAIGATDFDDSQPDRGGE